MGGAEFGPTDFQLFCLLSPWLSFANVDRIASNGHAHIGLRHFECLPPGVYQEKLCRYLHIAAHRNVRKAACNMVWKAERNVDRSAAQRASDAQRM